jgi:hypothetical protein
MVFLVDDLSGETEWDPKKVLSTELSKVVSLTLSLLCRFVIQLVVLAVFCLPSAASAQVDPGVWNSAVWFERSLGQGIKWRHYHFDQLFGAKQSVSYVEVDLADPNVNLQIKHREAFVGPSPGLSSPLFPRAFTSTFAAEVPHAKAAINGTYFNTNSYDVNNPTVAWGGGTTFLRINGSTIVSSDGTHANLYPMGILFNSKSDLTIQRRTAPWSTVTGSWSNMMICGPVLLENGVIETYEPTNNHANARHPRSAVGKINASNKLILLTVDGRTDQAAGMSCTELAHVLKSIGCDNAINLDGGGSSTLWGSGEPFNGILNFPSDNGAYDRLGERACANALVFSSADVQPAAFDARLTGLTYNTLTRTGENLTVTATYTNIGSETWTPSTVRIIPSRPMARSSVFIPAGQETTFATMSPAIVAPGQSANFTLSLVPPTVSTATLFEENFALTHTVSGYFGPPDSALKVRTTVRAPLSGAPSMIVVQGTATGPNNQWYDETGSTGWSNSTVGFTAAGVSNGGTQRFCGTGEANRFAAFRPIFDVPGIYRVDVAFPPSTNNITAVQYTVNHLQGSHGATLNQNLAANANVWHTLGEFEFGTGVSGNFGLHSVHVTNGSMVMTTPQNRFYSGAVRFDYVGPLPNQAAVTDWTMY